MNLADASHLATAIGAAIAATAFVIDRLRAGRARRAQQFFALNSAYLDYLRLYIEHADLNEHPYAPKVRSLSPEQRRRSAELEHVICMVEMAQFLYQPPSRKVARSQGGWDILLREWARDDEFRAAVGKRIHCDYSLELRRRIEKALRDEEPNVVRAP